MRPVLCRCGRPIPRSSEEWRYETCSDKCWAADMAVERIISQQRRDEQARTQPLRPKRQENEPMNLSLFPELEQVRKPSHKKEAA